MKCLESVICIDQDKNIFVGRPESQVYYLFIRIQCANAPTIPNPGDPWDGDWFVDEGSVVVRVGVGPE